MPKFLSDGIFDGSSTDLTVDGSFRSKGDLNYFGLDNISNEAEIVINTGNSGSPQIGFTENGDASWAIGVDDADNGFKIHGSVGATIPTINNLSKPFFEIDTIGQIFQRPPTDGSAGSYTKLGFEVSTQEVALELGDDRTGSGFAYIDLIGDTTYADYGLRLIRWNGGANTTSHLRHRGTGYLEIETEDGGDILINPNSGNVGIFETNPSQKLHVSGNARVTGAYYDSNNSPGTSGQVLSSIATGTDWINQGDVIAGEADKAKSVVLRVKNSTASPMTKGQVICEAVSASPPSGNLIEVALADNNGTNTMPALGVLNEDLDAAGGANDEGDAIMFGKVSGIDTSAFDVGDEVFVSDTPGGLTITKPTGVKYIQKVGVVIRDDNTNGTIEVFGAGRVNDVPTPLYVDHANQRLGIGAINPSEKLEVQGSVNNDDVAIRIENTYDDNLSSSRPAAALTFETASNNGHLRVYGAPADTAANHQIDLGSTAASSYLTFSPNGSEKMRVTSGGNVGIGAPNPSGKLEVRQSANNGNTGAFTNTHVKLTASATADNTGFVGITAATSTADNYGYSFGAQRTSGGVGDFKINYHNNSAAGLNRFIINQNGNVGIGNPNPSYLLDVNEDDNAVAFRVTGGGGGAAMASFVRDVGSTGASVNINAQSNFPQIQFVSTGNTFSIGADSSGNFKISDNTSIGTSDRITIDNIGNVGINDTDPDAKLTVFRTDSTYTVNLSDTESRAGLSVKSSSSFDSKLTISSGASSRQYIQAVNNAATTGRDIVINPYGGDVGIGTTSPGSKLDVSGGDIRLSTNATYLRSKDSASAIPRVLGMNASNTFYIGPIDSYAGGAIVYGVSSNVSYHGFYGGGSEKVRINSAGNVGIRTTNPQTGLHLSSGVDNRTVGGTDVGIIRLTNTYGTNFGAGGEIQFGLQDVSGRDVLSLIKGSYTGYDSGNYGGDLEFHTRKPDGLGLQQRMTITDAGNVGIGVDAPAEQLDVAGSIKATGMIWAGYDAGTTNSVSCSNWFRSNGTTGWFNASYSGGIYMTDTTNVTVYNNKAFRVNNTGTLSIRSAGDIVAYYSDERLKTNLGNITNAVDKVKKLNGFYYTNNDLAQEFGYTEKQVQVGVSAQEVENVMPEVVKPAPFDLGVNENGSTYSISGDDYKTVKYEKLVPLLIEAIKEQQKQIDELKNQLNAFTK
jgi:hypothetical protein